MPELLEVEAYRQLAERAVGRRIAEVDAPDTWYLKGAVGPAAVAGALLGGTFTAARRRGKLLLLDVDGGWGEAASGGSVLGLRFGMTGRLVVDDVLGVAELEYGSNRDVAAWVRFRVGFADGGHLRMVDPRRLGGVELDPDEERLGFDAASMGVADLRSALAGSRAPLKARLLDQHHVAGVGNLLADDILWRARLDPTRPASDLAPTELRRLHRAMGASLRQLGQRGGSHTGALQPERHRDGHCPRCGAPLQRRVVGGRTTYSCPVDQR